MANPTFTIVTQFGLSSGPSFQGQIVTDPAVVSANPTIISAPNVIHGDTITVDADGFLISELRGLGFVANLSAVQTDTPGTDPYVTVRLVNADGGAADIDIVLYDGESKAWPDNVLPTDMDTGPSAIKIIGDTATGDFDVYGIINLGMDT